MRAEQVFIVSEGTIENPLFLFFFPSSPSCGGGGLLGSSPEGAGTALLSPLMHVGTEP